MLSTQNLLILVSGISGSGKTTIGKILADALGCDFLDQDSFYLNEKPEVIINDEKNKQLIVKNWDCMQSVDVKAMNNALINRSKTKGLVFVGFAPLELEVNFTHHFHLLTGKSDNTIIDRCIQARRVSKGFAGKQAERDELVVRKLVFPFQQLIMKSLEKRKATYIHVYSHSMRRTIQDIRSEMIEHIENSI